MVYRGDTLLGSQISELKTDSFIRFKIKWIILFERQRSTRSRRSLSFFSSPAKRQAACLATRLGYRVRAKWFLRDKDGVDDVDHTVACVDVGLNDIRATNGHLAIVHLDGQFLAIYGLRIGRSNIRGH